MRRLSVLLLVAALAFGISASIAAADHDGDPDVFNMSQVFASPNSTGATNSDFAFWGTRAYAGNYNGFRIFDISDPANPDLLVDYPCFGPQQDPAVWKNKLLFTAVDSVLTAPECGSGLAANVEDPTAWEGVRIFDVSDPEDPEFIKGVYTDCGAHTITLWPKNPAQVLLYVSSYSLRRGPTCGPTTGDSPTHEKISVIRVPIHNPKAAKVIAQPKISYPGDPDNQFDPAEHGLGPPFLPLTACHDIGVFVELRLAAGACAEQAQLWRVKKNGIPDTQHPLWVYDDNVDTDGPGGGDVAVDFWHSATFSWDGSVVNFIDESFGFGCPTETEWSDGSVNDTGRMFFLDTATGAKLSDFVLPRAGEVGYCSAHLGVPVAAKDRNLLVNAWYEGGIDVIDFTDPADPFEVAYYDDNNDNWSAYWYEGPRLPGNDTLTIYASEGVEMPQDANGGFQVYSASVGAREVRLPFLNPQTQMRVIP